MKREYSAGIIVYLEAKNGREYLLLHYPPSEGMFSGHWGFSKGHIEKDETKEQAALRELKEETALTVTLIEGFEESVSYFYRLPQTKELSRKTVSFFIGKTISKHVVLSYEHIGYVWLPFDQAFEQLTYDNEKELLKKADHFLD
jgi:bis(5'-nucleosidyl)-tetraphosphatase